MALTVSSTSTVTLILTCHLDECVAETIENDLREETPFIQRYDDALDETQGNRGIPDKRASLLVCLIENKGRLAKNKRDLFSEVTDEELALR